MASDGSFVLSSVLTQTPTSSVFFSHLHYHNHRVITYTLNIIGCTTLVSPKSNHHLHQPLFSLTGPHPDHKTTWIKSPHHTQTFIHIYWVFLSKEAKWLNPLSHHTPQPTLINSLHTSAECQIIQAPPVDHLYPLNHCPNGYKTQYILADCSLPLIHQPHNSYIQYTVAKLYLSLNPADIPITTLNPCFLVPKPTLHRSQTI